MKNERIPAFISYLLPVIGWLYVLVFERKNDFAMFHMRQSVGVVLYSAAALLLWAVVGWVLAWVPFGFIVSIILFTLVMLAILVSVIAWIVGMVYALQGRVALLPFVGGFAYRLPF